MQPNFSFCYNEQKYDYSNFQNDKLVLDDTLTVTLKKQEYPKYSACCLTLYFENTGTKNSGIISDISDCDINYKLKEVPQKKNGHRPEIDDVFVKSMNGMVEGDYYWDNDRVSAEEYQFSDVYLKNGQTRHFENVGARSSEGTMPFFTLEYKNKGIICAIGWTGAWKADYQRNDDVVNIRSGLQKARFYLKSGEKVRTSSTLIMEYSEGEDKFNKFRRLIKNHFSHYACTKADRESLMAVALWGGLSSEEMKKRLKELTERKISFEDVWIDAGWFGQCTDCDDEFVGDWSRNVGDWEVNRRVHPNGFSDVAKTANEGNMKLMLWFEPERAIDKVSVCKEHPEWFLSIPNSENRILNYGNDEALEYVYNTISSYIEKLNLSCYRQDFNVRLSDYFAAGDERNREGITEIKHILGMYELWDRLLESYPQLIIDNCASGGRRIDIETLKRSIPFFRSDYLCNYNAKPEVLQVHNTGISNYFPYSGCAIRYAQDTYAARSSYSSSWGAMYWFTIFQSMNDEALQWAKEINDEYLKIRHYFTMDFYNHASSAFGDTSWTIWQYHDYEDNSGIVMAFRRPSSPFESAEIELKGLDEKAYNYSSFDDTQFEVRENRLKITLPQKRSSTIIEYKIEE